MRRFTTPLLVVALMCTGCSKTSQSKAADTADAIAADVNATAAAAVVETSRALDAASVKIDAAGNAADAAGDRAAAQAADANDHITRAAARMREHIAPTPPATGDAADRTANRIDSAM